MVGSFEVMDTKLPLSYRCWSHFLSTEGLTEFSLALHDECQLFHASYLQNDVYVFNSRMYFSGSSFQMFSVCQVAFCKLTKEKVRNDPKHKNVVILKSHTPTAQTEAGSSHQQVSSEGFRLTVIEHSEKNPPPHPISFSLGRPFQSRIKNAKAVRFVFRYLDSQEQEM